MRMKCCLIALLLNLLACELGAASVGEKSASLNQLNLALQQFLANESDEALSLWRNVRFRDGAVVLASEFEVLRVGVQSGSDEQEQTVTHTYAFRLGDATTLPSITETLDADGDLQRYIARSISRDKVALLPTTKKGYQERFPQADDAAAVGAWRHVRGAFRSAMVGDGNAHYAAKYTRSEPSKARRELTEPQKRAMRFLGDGGVGEPRLVAHPTGSGKTIVAMHALDSWLALQPSSPRTQVAVFVPDLVSAQQSMSVLSSLLGYADNHILVGHDPSSGAQAPHIKLDKPVVRFFPADALAVVDSESEDEANKAVARYTNDMLKQAKLVLIDELAYLCDEFLAVHDFDDLEAVIWGLSATHKADAESCGLSWKVDRYALADAVAEGYLPPISLQSSEVDGDGASRLAAATQLVESRPLAVYDGWLELGGVAPEYTAELMAAVPDEVSQWLPDPNANWEQSASLQRFWVGRFEDPREHGGYLAVLAQVADLARRNRYTLLLAGQALDRGTDIPSIAGAAFLSPPNEDQDDLLLRDVSELTLQRFGRAMRASAGKLVAEFVDVTPDLVIAGAFAQGLADTGQAWEVTETTLPLPPLSGPEIVRVDERPASTP